MIIPRSLPPLSQWDYSEEAHSYTHTTSGGITYALESRDIMGHIISINGDKLTDGKYIKTFVSPAAAVMYLRMLIDFTALGPGVMRFTFESQSFLLMESMYGFAIIDETMDNRYIKMNGYVVVFPTTFEAYRHIRKWLVE